MAGGVRTTNVPSAQLIELLGHYDAGGGRRALGRSTLAALVDALRGVISNDPTGVSALRADLVAGLAAREAEIEAVDTALRDEARVRKEGLDAEVLARGLVIDTLDQALRDEARVRGEALAAEAQARNGVIAVLDQAVRDEARVRAEGIDAEARIRADAVFEESRFRTEGDDGLRLSILALRRDLEAVTEVLAGLIRESAIQLAGEIEQTRLFALTTLLNAGRPGLCPGAFTASALGAIEVSRPLDAAGRLATTLGPAYRLGGGGVIAPRAPIPVDPDTVHVLRVRYWRLSDVLDPNNSALDLGIQWLGAVGEDVGRTLLRRESNLRVQDGPRTLSFRVPSLADELPAIVPPKASVSWRPYLRTYGADGATAVEMLSVGDASFAGVYAPDMSDLAARLRTIEGQLALGLPLASPILPAYAVADLPKPGIRGRKAWASDGRARGADGALEPANAGSGIEVADNGTRWVVPGTNQQVQS